MKFWLNKTQTTLYSEIEDTGRIIIVSRITRVGKNIIRRCGSRESHVTCRKLVGSLNRNDFVQASKDNFTISEEILEFDFPWLDERINK